MTFWAFLDKSRAGILACGHDNLKAIPITALVAFYKGRSDFLTIRIPFIILVIYVLSLYVTSSAMCSFVLLLWKHIDFGRKSHFSFWEMEFLLVNIYLFLFSSRLCSALEDCILKSHDLLHNKNQYSLHHD